MSSIVASTSPSSNGSSSAVVLITGGSGLVGQAIRKMVAEEHAKGEFTDQKFVFLSSKDGDLRDYAACEAIFNKYKPTHVIHLAAFVGGLYRNMKVSGTAKIFFMQYSVMIVTMTLHDDTSKSLRRKSCICSFILYITNAATLAQGSAYTSVKLFLLFIS